MTFFDVNKAYDLFSWEYRNLLLTLPQLLKIHKNPAANNEKNKQYKSRN